MPSYGILTSCDFFFLIHWKNVPLQFDICMSPDILEQQHHKNIACAWSIYCVLWTLVYEVSQNGPCIKAECSSIMSQSG